jgi:hypothetical protein
MDYLGRTKIVAKAEWFVHALPLPLTDSGIEPPTCHDDKIARSAHADG